jgi:hypothetical protein
MRYVLKTSDGQFVKFIQWTAGVSPLFLTADFDDSMILTKDYLNYVIELVGKTRVELIMEKYPDLEILKVETKILYNDEY